MRAQTLTCLLTLTISTGAAAQAPKPATTGGGKTEITWWGHAAFTIKTPAGTLLAIDPFLKNPKAPKDAKAPEKLDAILVTHGHADHVGDTVELAKKTGATVLGSYELTNLIGAEKSAGGNPGGSVTIKDVTIHYVEAVHSSSYGDGKDAKYAGAPLGYVIEIQNGPTLYHAGDTNFFASMSLIAERYAPQVAMLPIGGHFTMDPTGAAMAAKLLNVKTVIPMHFGTFPPLVGTPEQLKEQLKKRGATATMQELKPGQTVQL